MWLMPLVAWAPAESDPRISSVLAPQGHPLPWWSYRDRLERRLGQLLEKEDPEEALEQMRALAPQVLFQENRPEMWPHYLLEEAEEAGSLPGGTWPQQVDQENLRAAEALREVSLTAWLNLAIPRERD
jgi:hypothetical protein